MGFPILVRWHLYIESGPSSQRLVYHNNPFSDDSWTLTFPPRYPYWEQRLSDQRWLDIDITFTSHRCPFDLDLRVSLLFEQLWAKVSLVISSWWATLWYIFLCDFRADTRLAPSQWETSVQSNAVSHWLGANLESAWILLKSYLPEITFA